MEIYLFHFAGAEGWAGNGSQSLPGFSLSKQNVVVFTPGMSADQVLKTGIRETQIKLEQHHVCQDFHFEERIVNLPIQWPFLTGAF